MTGQQLLERRVFLQHSRLDVANRVGGGVTESQVRDIEIADLPVPASIAALYSFRLPRGPKSYSVVGTP